MEGVACDPVSQTRSFAFGVLDLPEDVVAKLSARLCHLDLVALEATCSRLRATVLRQALWQKFCWAHCPALTKAVRNVEIQDVDWFKLQARDLNVRGYDKASREAVKCIFFRMSSAERASVLYKKLHTRLNRFEEPHSLVWRAVHASSTDGSTQLDWLLSKYAHDYVEDTVVRPRHWGSVPTAIQGSNEDIVLQLVHPLCLVRRIRLRLPDDLHGLHRPLGVKFHFGFNPGHEQDMESRDYWAQDKATVIAAYKTAVAAGKADWLFSTDTYPVSQEEGESRQLFTVPPTLCPGGLMKMEFLGKGGKPQRAGSSMYDVRIISVKVHGVLMRDMHMGPNGKLRPMKSDPLSRVQDLLTYSHEGRFKVWVPPLDSDSDGEGSWSRSWEEQQQQQQQYDFEDSFL